MAETKKSSGRMGEYHSGCMRSWARRKRVPKRRLVEGRQTDSGDHQHKSDVPHDPQRPHPVQALEDDGHELERQHGQVEHHAPADLEKRRVGLPEEDHPPDVPGSPQVRHQPECHRDISEEGGQYRRTHQSVIAIEVKDVDGGGNDEATGRERHPRKNVESDPQPPGRGVGESGGGSETAHIAGDSDRGRRADEQPENGLGEDDAGVVDGRHDSSPASLSAASVDGLWSTPSVSATFFRRSKVQ